MNSIQFSGVSGRCTNACYEKHQRLLVARFQKSILCYRICHSTTKIIRSGLIFSRTVKANVPSRTLCEICLAQVNIAVQAFEDLEASDRVYYGSADDEFSAIDRTHDVHLNMAETTLKKERSYQLHSEHL